MSNESETYKQTVSIVAVIFAAAAATWREATDAMSPPDFSGVDVREEDPWVREAKKLVDVAWRQEPRTEWKQENQA